MNTLKLPEKERVAMLSTFVSEQLLRQVKARKPKGVSLRAVVEYGLRAYLLELSQNQEKQLEMFGK